ncbi:MAG: GNAT family N-acetyltransferase, partial [Planctomycetota bacterium]|nr:GNAT family N-acetyltransferase [Planctomycetota bacterium]
LFDCDGADSLVWAEEGGVTLSACGIQTRELVVPGERLRVGLIGSVATDPAARGQGLAGHVLTRAEQVLRGRACLFSLLWADDPAFYEPRGYRLVGRETDFVIDPARRELLPLAHGVRAATPRDRDAIHELYSAHPARVDRSPEETRTLLSSPGMVVLVRGMPGAVTAYLCLGRGDDLQGVIHEWGGPSQDVLALVGACLDDHLHGAQVLFLMAGPGERNLKNTLDALGFESAEGCLGMARLLDAQGAALLAERRVGRDLAVSCVSDGSLELRGPRASERIAAEEFLTLLLPVKGERRAHWELGQRLGVDLSALALEPFLWGLDSI